MKNELKNAKNKLNGQKEREREKIKGTKNDAGVNRTKNLTKRQQNKVLFKKTESPREKLKTIHFVYEERCH